MTVSPQVYKSSLSDLEVYMGIILERYKNALINFNVQKNSQNEINYNNVKLQLDNGFSKLFILQNNVNKSFEGNNTNVKEKDKKISVIKNMYDHEIAVLKEKTGMDLASQPFEKQKHIDLAEHYTYLGYYSLAIIIGVVFLYKH